MLRSILIGLDNSESGIAAQELGLRWSRQLGSRLVGMTIVDDPGIQLTEDMLFGDIAHSPGAEVLVAEAHVKTPTCLRAVEDGFRRRCGEAGVAFELVEGVGSPHLEILLEAQKHDLVVLGQGSRFEYGWESNPGETVARVLRDTPRPIVAVPDSSGRGESIVVAYDGSLPAARALAAFVATGLDRGRRVHVVNAASSGRKAAVRTADRAIAFLRAHEITATPHILESARDPAQSILKKAETLDAGLLVMGAYGQPALREFFVGSFTRSILKESPIPVFCFH
jgi:nucleotide-binding universal stress UspA family protein